MVELWMGAKNSCEHCWQFLHSELHWKKFQSQKYHKGNTSNNGDSLHAI